LGERFLLEGNYEQAMIHFARLIEIEPMNPRAWMTAFLPKASGVLTRPMDNSVNDTEIQALSIAGGTL